jgi:hypothetical protein
MEQSSTQSSKWQQVAHRVRLCRETFVTAFRVGRAQRFEDELVRNGLSLVETRVSSVLDALRHQGTVLNLDAHHQACRHITRSMATDHNLHAELTKLKCLPLDKNSAQLHLAALDRGIGRELPALVSVLLDETSTADPEGGTLYPSDHVASISKGRTMCRRYKAGIDFSSDALRI